MSQENMELVNAFNGAWNAGDWDAVRDLSDPAVVVRPNEDWPERGPFVGHDAVIRWYSQLRDTWDAVTIEAISQTDAHDRVVVRYIAHGAGRGPVSEIEFTTVVTFRNVRVVSVEFFWNHAEALEMVGLSEQDVHADS